MNTSLRQLEAFVQGADLSSFSAAAARIGISQPGYSLLIRQLERSLGVALFNRTTRRVELTDAGHALLESARRTVEDARDVHRRAEDLRTLRQGRLRLAIAPSAARGILPGALARFRHAYPNVRIELFEDLAAGLAARVRSNQAEIGLGLPLRSDPDLHFTTLLRDRLVAVLPIRHPLASRRSLSWKALSPHEHIMVTTQSSVRAHVDDAARAAGIRLLPSLEVGSLAAAVGLVRAGLGYTILPGLGLEALVLTDVRVRPIGQPEVWRDIGLLRQTRQPLSPTALAFVAAVRATTDALVAASRDRMLASSDSRT